MKISFWIPAIVLCVARIVNIDSFQVGTVLFTATDLVKSCWIDRDKSLLKARLIMQDVLPDPDFVDFSKPDIVTTLVDYFYSCYDIIRTSTSGNVQNLMLTALSDSVGGYLRAYVLPFTKKSYYAGQINYSDAKNMFQMYDEIKCYLRTNGLGWAEPKKVYGKDCRPKPLFISEKGGRRACKSLYTIEKKTYIPNGCKIKINEGCTEKPTGCGGTQKPTGCGGHQRPRPKHRHRAKSLREFKGLEPADEDDENFTIYSQPNITNAASRQNGDLKKRLREYYRWTITEKQGRSRFPKQVVSVNNTDVDPDNGKREKRLWGCLKRSRPKHIESKIVIPLPLLDNPQRPQAIAVPFRNQPLRNLQTRNSAFVLEHYYASAIKCLFNKNQAKRDIKNFNAEFYSWLVSEVCPRLSDEQWYPGFGGVLRVLETIKEYGAEPLAPQDTEARDVAFMFPKGVKFHEKRKTRPRGNHRTRQVEEDEDEDKPRKYFIFSILVITAFGVLLLCACLFCVCQTLRTMGNNKEIVPKKDANKLNLEYIVQFFKKTESQEKLKEKMKDKGSDASESRISRHGLGARYVETARRNIWVGRTDVAKTRLSNKEKSTKDDQNERTKDKKKTETKHKTRQLVNAGQGDAATYVTSNAETSQPEFESAVKPTWPRRGSFLEKTGPGAASAGVDNAAGDGPGKKSKPSKDLEKVETLWKIPSARFARTARKGVCTSDSKTKDSQETSGTEKPITGSDSLTASAEDGRKDYSTEKRSSSYGYSGSGSQSRVTTTYSSSQTQVEDKISSATMEFFEKVMGKQKPFAKSSTQETTAESDTDGDGSYSSETDY